MFVVPNRQIYLLTVENPIGKKTVIEVSDDHPFWVDGKQWIKSIDLKVGDVLSDAEQRKLKFVSLVPTQRIETTYNLEVDGYHTYFASDAKVWVHNIDCWKTVVESASFAKNVEKGFGPQALEEINRAGGLKELLATGKRGKNQHSLSGNLQGWEAVDIPGTGKGRGAGRLIFRVTENTIEIKGVVRGHDYSKVIE